MKESRFVELLNLYIDQEISPEDAALLEHEIMRDPQRRKRYVQYCRMHRASAILFERFRAGVAPSGDTLAQAARDVDEKILLFPRSSRSHGVRNWGIAAGLVAAAACLTLIFVRPDGGSGVQSAERSDLASSSQISSATDSSSNNPQNRVQLAQSLPAASSGANSSYQPAFVVQRLGQPASLAAQPEPQMTTQVAWDWMNQVQMAPVQIVPAADLIFETKPSLQQDPRTFRGLRPIQANFEMGAFQFQK